MVKLPFKSDSVNLGKSRSQALRRFYAIEQKLNKDASLNEAYSNTMNKFITLGILSLVEDS